MRKQINTDADECEYNIMLELIHKLGIDWKLLIAQIINFAALFLILRKFLYKPILGMLEKRRIKIENSLKNAERLEKEIAEIKEQREKILANAMKKSDEILKEARGLGEQRKTEILEQAKKEIEKMINDAKILIEKEKAKLFEEARAEIANLVVLVAEKIIREKINEESDRKFVEEILGEIKSRNV